MLFLLSIGAVIIVFFLVIYAIIMRGSLGLLKKRLREDPDARANVDESDLDGLPTDIKY